MRRAKAIRRLILAIVIAAAAFVALVYVQANRVPDAYRPARLTQAEKEQAARDFVHQSLDFCNRAQDIEPYTWTVTAKSLNAYLASMDEIASQSLPGRIKAGGMMAAFEKAGLADPAISLSDGKLSLMVRSKRYSKIMSIDLTFEMSADKGLMVRMADSRIGRLGLPRAMAAKAMARLKEEMRRRLAQRRSQADAPGGPRRPGASLPDIEAILATVITSIDEKPIPTEYEIEHKAIRIENIRITPEGLSIDVKPIRRTRPARSAARRLPHGDWPAEMDLP